MQVLLRSLIWSKNILLTYLVGHLLDFKILFFCLRGRQQTEIMHCPTSWEKINAFQGIDFCQIYIVFIESFNELKFSESCDIKAILEFYLQICSLEMNCDGMSVLAATLANGGVCPITEKRVMKHFPSFIIFSIQHSNTKISLF